MLTLQPEGCYMALLVLLGGNIPQSIFPWYNYNKYARNSWVWSDISECNVRISEMSCLFFFLNVVILILKIFCSCYMRFL